jgi:hypothetical protein
VPWAKLSDDFHSHRAIRRAGLEGAGFFALALSYSAKYLTDGFVDDEWVDDTIPSVAKRGALLKRLVELRLLNRVEGGYLIPSYLNCNPSRADAEAKRAAQREAGRRTAERRWGDRSSDSSRGRSTNGSTDDGLHAPSRTRPVPVPSETSGSNQGEGVNRKIDQLIAHGVLEEVPPEP